jgi:hypothetical protein
VAAARMAAAAAKRLREGYDIATSEDGTGRRPRRIAGE